jgi:hypothetical protein
LATSTRILRSEAIYVVILSKTLNHKGHEGTQGMRGITLI